MSEKSGADPEEFEHYLFGDLLSTTSADVLLAVLLGVVILTIFILNYRRIFAVTFDENFAQAIGVKTARYHLLFAILASVTVVLGMRLVGSLLISSLTIFPVLTAETFCKNFKSVLIASGLIAVVTFTTGFFISLAFDLSAGATVVLTSLAALIFVKVVAKIRQVC